MNVILGTGPLGFAVMRELVRRRKPVRMVNTSGVADVPDGVELAKADLYNVEEAKAAMQGADVVFQCAQPPYHKWPELFPKLQESIMAGAAAVRARIVVADNLYMYGEVDGDIHEGLPYRANTRKGRVRAALADRWMEAHRQGKLKAVIGRGSNFFGPHVSESIVGDMLFKPALAGKKCTLLGNLDMPHTLTYIEDFGRALVTLSEYDDAYGESWHVPNAETVTLRQFAEAAYRAAGFPPKAGAMSRTMLKIGGMFIPAARETIEMLYQFEKPFVVSCRKFTERFNLQATPLDEAIRATVAWYRQAKG